MVGYWNTGLISTEVAPFGGTASGPGVGPRRSADETSLEIKYFCSGWYLSPRETIRRGQVTAPPSGVDAPVGTDTGSRGR